MKLTLLYAIKVDFSYSTYTFVWVVYIFAFALPFCSDCDLSTFN